MARAFPPWLVKRVPLAAPKRVEDTLRDLSLHTVCRSARCPNRLECFADGTATFLIMGEVCTRNCRFCAIEKGAPRPLDPDEPARLAEAVRRLGLRYVVVTSVTRDDLPDGGAAHFADVIRSVRRLTSAQVEVLVPDFGGRQASVASVLDAGPAVFNHNVETIRRLYPEVRPLADYGRSLNVLRYASHRGALTKSGFMVGLGEREAEVLGMLRDLREAGVALVTVGQYLSPGGSPLEVKEFVRPEVFERYRAAALAMGFAGAVCGPFVRSSYCAAELAAGAGGATIGATRRKGRADGSETAGSR